MHKRWISLVSLSALLLGVLVVCDAGAAVRIRAGGMKYGGGVTRVSPPRPQPPPNRFPGHRPGFPCWGYGYGYTGWNDWSGGWPWWWWYHASTYDGPPLIEVVRRVDPQILGLQPEGVPAPPPPDPGLTALGNRDYPRAVVVYAQKITDGGTTDDRRLMAVAMVGARRFADAAIAIKTAYDADATLRERSFNGPSLVGGEMEFRRLVTNMVEYAHRAKTPEAWTAVGVLMQAEGRHAWARKMFERSEDLRERLRR